MTDLATGPARLQPEIDGYRRELTAHCYRMLGSAFDAEDAVQETLVRAWRAFDRFEGRSAVRSWLYRIATNVCLTMLESRGRRARPMDLGPAGGLHSELTQSGEATWIEPIPDERVVDPAGDPAEQAVVREGVRLAFIAALQHLPPKQRAVLILREVLQWSAAEVAELLDTSVASVNSALQRARATIAAREITACDDPMDAEHQALLERYAAAFERYDITAMVALLHEDATLSMPPYDLWLRGPADIAAWFVGPGAGCRGSRLVATTANGLPAFAQYRPGGPGGRHEAWSLQVLEFSGGRLTAFNAFLDVQRVFPMFGLPLTLE